MIEWNGHLLIGIGMPGWKAFVEPILRCIDPSAAPKPVQEEPSEESIITLGVPKILVPSEEVAKSIRNLSTLLTSHPHPSLAKRLLRPILLPLWAITSWHHGDETTEVLFCKPARQLLSALVQLSPSSKDSASDSGKLSSSYILSTILQNLTFKGRPGPGQKGWEYAAAKGTGIQIQESVGANHKNLTDFGEIDVAVDRFLAFIATFGGTPDFDAQISSLFMDLCSKWFSQNSMAKNKSKIIKIWRANLLKRK
jgi:hypothetical protein